MKTEHSTAVQSKARSALSSASEHEAIVARLEAKLRQSEAEYRSARSVRASLEAELSAARQQLAKGREAEAEAARRRGEERDQAEAALAEARGEAEALRRAAGAAESARAELQSKLDAATRRRDDDAAAHRGALQQRERRVAELEGQLDTGKPSEAAMFNIARDQAGEGARRAAQPRHVHDPSVALCPQAKRDAEADKLRAQLASLRKMLKESHRVLSHLMKQESALKAEGRGLRARYRDSSLSEEEAAHHRRSWPSRDATSSGSRASTPSTSRT